jgi:hypothetical protein
VGDCESGHHGQQRIRVAAIAADEWQAANLSIEPR